MRAGRCDKMAVYKSLIHIGRALSGFYTALSSYFVLSGSNSEDCLVFGNRKRGIFCALDGWKTGMRAGRSDEAAVYMPPIHIGRVLSGLYTAFLSYRVLSGSNS